MKLTSQWELLLPGPEERALRPLVVHSGSFTTRTQLLPDFCVTSAVGSGTAFYHTAALGEGLRGWDFVLQMDSTGRIFVAVLWTWGGVHSAHVAWLFRKKSFFIADTRLYFQVTLSHPVLS